MDLIINDQLELASLPAGSFMMESQVNFTTEHSLGSGLTGTQDLYSGILISGPSKLWKALRLCRDQCSISVYWWLQLSDWTIDCFIHGASLIADMRLRSTATLKGHSGRVWCCAWSPKGEVIMIHNHEKIDFLRFWRHAGRTRR